MVHDEMVHDEIVDRMDKLLPLGLLAAWVANDLEEWFTMAPWSARNAEQIRSLPIRVPWPHDGMPARQAHIAISIVGAGIMFATVRGIQTKRRSLFYRASILAFGIHGFTHIGQSIMLRRYTPGVITGVTVMIPYWLWAEATHRRLADDPYTRGEILGALAILASLPAIVATAGCLAKVTDGNGKILVWPGRRH